MPSKAQKQSVRNSPIILQPSMLTHDLKSSTWESLPESWPEWVVAIQESKEAWEKMLGRSLTPQEVFDLEFDKDAKAEIEAQE